jgi:hypothetical protein
MKTNKLLAHGVGYEKTSPSLVDHQYLAKGLSALSRSHRSTTISGHNVIFASIAIWALKDHPVFATPSISSGIRQLISNFDGTTPGSGYYGVDRGRIDGTKVNLSTGEEFPPYADLNAMADVVLDDLILNSAEKRQGQEVSPIPPWNRPDSPSPSGLPGFSRPRRL